MGVKTCDGAGHTVGSGTCAPGFINDIIKSLGPSEVPDIKHTLIHSLGCAF